MTVLDFKKLIGAFEVDAIDVTALGRNKGKIEIEYRGEDVESQFLSDGSINKLKLIDIEPIELLKYKNGTVKLIVWVK